MRDFSFETNFPNYPLIIKNNFRNEFLRPDGSKRQSRAATNYPLIIII